MFFLSLFGTIPVYSVPLHVYSFFRFVCISNVNVLIYGCFEHKQEKLFLIWFILER